MVKGEIVSAREYGEGGGENDNEVGLLGRPLELEEYISTGWRPAGRRIQRVRTCLAQSNL